MCLPTEKTDEALVVEAQPASTRLLGFSSECAAARMICELLKIEYATTDAFCSTFEFINQH